MVFCIIYVNVKISTQNSQTLKKIVDSSSVKSSAKAGEY